MVLKGLGTVEVVVMFVEVLYEPVHLNAPTKQEVSNYITSVMGFKIHKEYPGRFAGNLLCIRKTDG